MTDLLYLDDAYLRDLDARVIGVRPDPPAVALDRTVFYPTGGGQPHDGGVLAGLAVVDVRKEGDTVWHTLTLPDGGALPSEGEVVHGTIDWDRRHALMRTHTALHVLCGVIWNEWGKPVTGGNMEPLTARMDFEFDPLPERFGARVEELVNAELAAARPIEVSFLPRGSALEDRDLIRTKVNHDPGGRSGGPRRRHRRIGQAGRRRHPRPLHRRGRADPGGEDRVEGQGQQAHPTRGDRPDG